MPDPLSAAGPARAHAHAGRGPVRTLAAFVKIEHTLFALPFAVAALLLARRTNVPGPVEWAWVLAAMTGARSLAMALNRIVDRRVDAANPRTAGRELPSGALTLRAAVVFAAASLVVLVVATTQLDPLTRVLWPIPVAMFVAYPYLKRFTPLCHLFLGATIGLAPVGAWVAVTGELPLAAWLLGGAVACWIAGFDVIYATQDVAHDRAHGLHSLPADVGVGPALWATKILHAGAIACLLGAGALADAGWLYFVGVLTGAGILAYENAIVTPARLDRVAFAFLNLNATLSLGFGAFVIADTVLIG